MFVDSGNEVWEVGETYIANLATEPTSCTLMVPGELAGFLTNGVGNVIC